MKRQYLGDSKDSFKWDYHDYLTTAIGYKTLNVLLMMTPDDNSNDGKTKPDYFPARKIIIDFCNSLRAKRDIQEIKTMPIVTGSPYCINLHNSGEYITRNSRERYFTGLKDEENQIIFLDPDNGFEPSSFNEKHVRYSEVFSILRQISSESIVSVFQHFRYIKFTQVSHPLIRVCDI